MDFVPILRSKLTIPQPPLFLSETERYSLLCDKPYPFAIQVDESRRNKGVSSEGGRILYSGRFKQYRLFTPALPQTPVQEIGGSHRPVSDFIKVACADNNPYHATMKSKAK